MKLYCPEGPIHGIFEPILLLLLDSGKKFEIVYLTSALKETDTSDHDTIPDKIPDPLIATSSVDLEDVDIPFTMLPVLEWSLGEGMMAHITGVGAVSTYLEEVLRAPGFHPPLPYGKARLEMVREASTNFICNIVAEMEAQRLNSDFDYDRTWILLAYPFLRALEDHLSRSQFPPLVHKRLEGLPGTTLTAAACFAAYAVTLVDELWAGALTSNDALFPACERLRKCVYEDEDRRITSWWRDKGKDELKKWVLELTRSSAVSPEAIS